jgi:hypothetical protein
MYAENAGIPIIVAVKHLFPEGAPDARPMSQQLPTPFFTVAVFPSPMHLR